MWIRSQDKEILTNCNDFYIDEVNNGYIIEGNIGVLGSYSTKEKAIKVLDMIENHLQKLRNGDLLINKLMEQKHYNIEKYLKSSIKYCEYVFQMPLDSEVEENDK